MPENFENQNEAQSEITEAEYNILCDKIENVLENPPSEKEFLQAKKARDNVVAEFMKGKSLEWLNEQFDVPIPGEVEIPTLKILERIISNLTKDAEFARERAEHEKEHYESAIKNRFEPRLWIRFFKTKDEGVCFFPGVSIKAQKDANENDVRKGILETLKIVSELSPFDEEQLDRYKNDTPEPD